MKVYANSQGISKNPYPEPNQSNSYIDTYFFKVHSNILFSHLHLALLKVSFLLKFWKHS